MKSKHVIKALYGSNYLERPSAVNLSPQAKQGEIIPTNSPIVELTAEDEVKISDKRHSGEEKIMGLLGSQLA